MGRQYAGDGALLCQGLGIKPRGQIARGMGRPFHPAQHISHHLGWDGELAIGEVFDQNSGQQGIIGGGQRGQRQCLQAAGQIGKGDGPAIWGGARGDQQPPTRCSLQIVQIKQCMFPCRITGDFIGVLDNQRSWQIF